MDLKRFFETRRWSLSRELRLHEEIAGQLDLAFINYEQEVHLNEKDIIDFIVGDIGIEVKIKGQRRAIYKQCERYCMHDRIKTLLLATNAAMGMPAFINGRSVVVAKLGLAWL